MTAALVAEVQHREAEDAKFARMAGLLRVPAERDETVKPENRACFRAAHAAVRTQCGGYSDYSLQHSGVLVAACNHHDGDAALVAGAVKRACQGY